MVVGGCSGRELCFHGTSAALEADEESDVMQLWSENAKLRQTEIKTYFTVDAYLPYGRTAGQSVSLSCRPRLAAHRPDIRRAASSAYRGLRRRGIDSAARMKDRTAAAAVVLVHV